MKFKKHQKKKFDDKRFLIAPGKKRREGNKNRRGKTTAVSNADVTKLLPTTREEMEKRGWDELDVLLVSGDAYVDHPSFGIPLLGRLLESKGYRVGIVAQPRWEDAADVSRMGRPRLFAGIGPGCLDSMLAHYTAFRKKRHDDAYTPGGLAGARPNRAGIVYTNLLRQAFPGLPLVLGGIEGSLRRAAHYDFWSDSLRRSILFDARADILIYGMGENALLEIAERLKNGTDEPNLSGISGTARIVSREEAEERAAEEIPSFEEIEVDNFKLMTATLRIEKQVQEGCAAKPLFQMHGNRAVLIEPPASPLSQEEFDRLYELPFTREAHPSYGEKVPALDMIRDSVTAVRGCGGGCSFCSLALHQGRRIRSRSSESVMKEVKHLSTLGNWKGILTDVGGPTANAWGSTCVGDPTTCNRKSCYAPHVCKNLRLSQKEYLSLLRRLKSEGGVRHLRVSSGIRHDMALLEPDFVEGFCAEFVGGQLKLAPEHSVDSVLKVMRKSDFSLFDKFLNIFSRLNARTGSKQFIVPYIMSAHPGCTLKDMQELGRWFRSQGWKPQQVQCFIPTPGTVATAMFFSGKNEKGEKIHVARTDRDRRAQHSAIAPAGRPTRRK